MKNDIFQNLVLFCCLTQAFYSCDAQVNTSAEVPIQISRPESFNDYWYAGLAEINRYALSQSRYGEVREGEAIMVFVTEDFLAEEQVKKEFGNSPSISVLKLNYLKKFVTGIYDYSLMTSVFTPAAYLKNPFTQKVTFTAQDWCGQSFSQMNFRNREIEFQQRSYFQAEGDLDTVMAATYIEDDIWTKMRLEPQSLPLGKISMVPSQEYLRLNHIEIGQYNVDATLVLQVNDQKSNNEFYVYTLHYPTLDRTLKVHCQSSFPFKILFWEETTNVSQPTKRQVSSATLQTTMRESYWQLNKGSDEVYRDSLGVRLDINLEE